MPKTNTHQRMKLYEVYAYRTRNGRRGLWKVLDVEKRNTEDAVEQGKRYSKLMGYEYSHVTQQIGAIL